MKRLALMMLMLLGACLVLAQDESVTDDEIENPVEVRLEVFLVSQVGGEEQFRPATTARPGQVVEYRVTAVNRSPDTLPSGTVEVVGPILPQTTFIANSATPASDRILTEYSVDGGETFDAPPVIIGEGEDRRVVDPEEYVAVRWTLLVPMEPGQEENFFYRVKID